MTKEKALIIALQIIDTCKKHDENCRNCPFHDEGCIVTNGDYSPLEWRVAELTHIFHNQKKREGK